MCKAENKIVFRVDGKQMNLLAVLEVRADGNESWGGFLRFKKGKRCSLIFGLIIMTLVMASYILSGVHQELLISSPFHYGAFPSNPSLMEGENPSDAKEHHHQSSVNNISYVKDYPSIKLIINSITSRIEFTTRQLPNVEDLKKQELHVSSLDAHLHWLILRNGCFLSYHHLWQESEQKFPKCNSGNLTALWMRIHWEGCVHANKGTLY